MPQLDNLKLVNTNEEHLAHAGFAVLDVLQHLPPHLRVQAPAMLFMLLCRRYGVTPQDVMTPVTNVLAGRFSERNEHVQALLLYLQHELKD